MGHKTRDTLHIIFYRSLRCLHLMLCIVMYVSVSNYNPEGDDWEQVDGGLQYLAIPVNNHGINCIALSEVRASCYVL